MRNLLTQIGVPVETADQFEGIELPFELMPHQKKAFHLSLYHAKSGIYLPARTGKTIVMQLGAVYFAKFGFRTMVIMPPGLFDQYRNDFNRIKNHGLNIHVFDQGPVARKKLVDEWDQGQNIPDVLLLSREIFKLHWNELYRLNFRVLQYDECHMGLQSTTSKTYKAVRAFSQQNASNRLVLSTGTPVPNALENAFGLISLVTPFAYKSERHFRAQHCVYKEIFVNRGGRRDTISVIDHYENHELLKRNLYKQGITVSKREVLNLEAPNIQIIDTHLKPKHRRLYEQVLKERILQTPDSGLIDARQAQKLRMVALQLITCPEAYSETMRTADNAVYETLRALLSSINTDINKALIFANFTQSVETLARVLKDLEPAVIYGPNGPQTNAKNVHRFKTDKNCRVMIANPIAGGVGFTLGDVCTDVIFVEPVSTPGQFDQTMSRVMLKGQTEPIGVYILRVVDTISPKAIDAMQGKIQDLDKITVDRKSIFEMLKVKAK
jgi:SNF2 family DNA or RNA helicase